jgi:hypothetical protein
MQAYITFILRPEFYFSDEALPQFRYNSTNGATLILALLKGREHPVDAELAMSEPAGEYKGGTRSVAEGSNQIKPHRRVGADLFAAVLSQFRIPNSAF